jgi:hypothetical protein
MFRLFDANNDGRLSRDELRHLLSVVLPPTFATRLIDKLVDRVMIECGTLRRAFDDSIGMHMVVNLCFPNFSQFSHVLFEFSFILLHLGNRVSSLLAVSCNLRH